MSLPRVLVVITLAETGGAQTYVASLLPALVEMDRQDVDGVTELQTVVRGLPEADRTRIVDGMAPGLLEQASYLHTTFFADVDYLDEPGRPRSGGFYHVAMGFWNDRTLELYDFKRFDATFSQFVPLDAPATCGVDLEVRKPTRTATCGILSPIIPRPAPGATFRSAQDVRQREVRHASRGR